jgi:hypothetical protein
MKKILASTCAILTIITPVAAQEIVIDSIRGNGSMSFWGAEIGTTATVEWAASLTDAGRTNWLTLTNIVVTSGIMTNDIPMFFRVRGAPEMPAAYYAFDGNANDQSGHGNNGTVYGALLSTDRFGKTNSAYYFDGLNDYISVANNSSLNITNSLTISAWIQPYSCENFEAWVSRTLSAGSKSQWRASFGDATSKWGLTWATPTWRDRWINDTIPLGEWSHVVITADTPSKTIQFFRNGVEIATLSNETIDFQSSTGLLYIAHQTDNWIYFHGKIDEVRIYSRALAALEVQNLYLATRP